jgi:hypothetical protein
VTKTALGEQLAQKVFKSVLGEMLCQRLAPAIATRIASQNKSDKKHPGSEQDRFVVHTKLYVWRGFSGNRPRYCFGSSCSKSLLGSSMATTLFWTLADNALRLFLARE